MAHPPYWIEWQDSRGWGAEGAKTPERAVALATERFEAGASYVRVLAPYTILLSGRSRRVEEVERARKPMDLATWETMVTAFAKRNGYRVGKVYWRAHSIKHVREHPTPPYEDGFFRAYVHRDGKRHRLLCRWIPERGWRVARL